MKWRTHKTYWIILSGLSILLSWLSYNVFYSVPPAKEIRQIQKDFSALEKKQLAFQSSLENYILNGEIEKIWTTPKFMEEKDFFINIYQEDSLIFWNTNQIYFKSQTSSTPNHFVGNYPNGIYLVDFKNIGNYNVYIGSCLKTQFYYDNQSLENKISSHFHATYPISIQGEKKEDNFAISSSIDNSPLFYLHIDKGKKSSSFQELVIFLFFVFGLFAFLMALSNLLLPLAEKFKTIYFLYPILLIGWRYYSVQKSFFQLFEGFSIFDPSLYANSSLVPNLGSLIISLAVIGIVIRWIILSLQSFSFANSKGKIVLLLFFIGTLFYFLFISSIIESLLLNSSIFLVLEEVLYLSAYSIIVLLIFSFLFLSYHFLLVQLSKNILKNIFSFRFLCFFWLFSGITFSIYTLFFDTFINGITPFILSGIIFYLTKKGTPLNSLRYSLPFLILFSLYSAIVIHKSNLINEQQKIELYANQLVTDQDPVMEIEYGSTINELMNNPEFYQLIKNYSYFTAADFAFQLENCCLDDFWERYDIQFLFFKKEGQPLLSSEEFIALEKEDVEKIIATHTIPSNISDGLYFVKDYFKQLSYIGYQKIDMGKDSSVHFYLLFKSKKIPEKIGFPRLLMNEKSFALQNLENYSIARYSNGNLVMQFGMYSYPLVIKRLSALGDKNTSFVYHRGFEHFVYQQDDGLAVIISKPEKYFIEKLSGFSYLILFFGVIFLFLSILSKRKILFPFSSLRLSFKLQFVLMATVIGSYLVYGFIAINNVKKQFNVNTEINLKERMQVINNEIAHRIEDIENKEITHQDINNQLYSFIKNLAITFDTDINFYDNSGELIASSQPKLYAKGISAPRINSEAFAALYKRKRSEYIHYENYGNLDFLSGYFPLFDKNKQQTGYLNVQHFSKQNVLKNQMNSFIVALINLTVLLLIVTVLLVIIVSRWITTPLRLIQQSISKMDFGVENKPIHYEGNDEIGALVNEYNNKLKELELKAMQLAKSERESAWREMAKQVAHEIKNPLTPMKLSIQQFQRSFDSEAIDAKERIQKLVHSLIEQIDGLTKIANEFSNFAKMPKANEEKLDLLPLLENSIELYTSPGIEIKLIVDKTKEYFIYADKDLMIRVFNNLFKNSIQAKKEELHIEIEIQEKGKNYEIRITDDGEGIPQEIKDKIFVPNFTTKGTGSGLGLAMVKQIINTHNGAINFETEEGIGTTFFILLPKYNNTIETLDD